MREEPFVTSLPDHILRVTLANALRREGYQGLCEHEPPTPAPESAGAALGFFALTAIVLSFTLFVRDLADTRLWPTVGLFVAFFLFIVFLSALVGRIGEWPLYVVFAAWAGTAVAQLVIHGLLGVTLTHGVPLLILLIPVVLATRFGIRNIRALLATASGLVQGVPLFLPLVLIVLFLPLFSGDLWRAATSLTAGRGIALAFVALVPLLVILRQRLHKTLAGAFLSRAERIERLATSDSADACLQEAARVFGESEALFLRHHAYDRLTELLRRPNPTDYAPYIARSLEKIFRRQVDVRLVPLVFGTGLVLALYIYLLASIAVDRRVAETWVGAPISTRELNIFGNQTALPGGPYVTLAAFLGLTATAIFFAFVITESRHLQALVSTLIERPIDRCLVIATPYIALDEEVILSEDFSLETGSTRPAAE